mmetsp:Transcript_7042/g.15253  ORF Transcript_7042/g.15253 Transcript_7042/m.15253 type:complete len:202 (-) Transcript_7042:137-742(-)
MSPISAVMVPFAGSPDRQKHRRSSQFRTNSSSTPAPSTMLLKGWVSFRFSRGLVLAKFGRNCPAVRTAPASNRSATVGIAATAASRGSIFSISLPHCPVAPGPAASSSAPPSRPNPAACTKSPSGSFSPNVSYRAHSTRSPTASSTVRRGFDALGAMSGFRPEKKDGPVSKRNSPSTPLALATNPWAQPPGAEWDSKTAVL